MAEIDEGAAEASRKFALQQFITLREEIRDTKERLFKVMTVGIVGVPAANLLSRVLNVPGLLLLLPALVLVVALMYLADNHGLMRCGRFIRLNIEPRYPDVVGWEGWLESANDRRSVDRYVAYSFFLLFLLYYAGTVAMAAAYLLEHFHLMFVVGIVALYVPVGGLFLGYLIYNIRTRAVTSTEIPIEQTGTAVDEGDEASLR